nr:hypothetical protein [Spirochaetota bacterium]
NADDSELVYSVRTLLSEGNPEYCSGRRCSGAEQHNPTFNNSTIINPILCTVINALSGYTDTDKAHQL